MKLNMWMIVNRLGLFDIEYSLTDRLERTLNSVQPVVIPDTVHVIADGPDVLCQSDSGTIRIRELSEMDGYMLIQSLFNWYQDWLNRVDGAIMTGDYQKLTEELSDAFGNPVMLQDSNYRVLGMTGEFRPGEEPEEWAYSRRVGQSSVEGYALKAELMNHPRQTFPNNVRLFDGRKNSRVPYGGLFATIRFQGRSFAKLTVMEYNRPLNPGDYAAMCYVVQRMAIYYAAVSMTSENNIDDQTLRHLVAGEAVEPEKMLFFQSVTKKREPGWFSVLALQSADPAQQGDPNALLLLESMLSNRHTASTTCVYRDTVAVLLYSSVPRNMASQILQSLELRGYSHALRAGLSLGFSSLTETGWFYRQALQAMRPYHAEEGDLEVSSYYHLACRHLLLSSGVERLMSCEPLARKIWEQEPERRPLLETLRVYLEMERSSTLAAQKLFIHKNTLNYRIHVLREQTGWDLDNPYIRQYLSLSLYILAEHSKLIGDYDKA